MGAFNRVQNARTASTGGGTPIFAGFQGPDRAGCLLLQPPKKKKGSLAPPVVAFFRKARNASAFGCGLTFL